MVAGAEFDATANYEAQAVLNRGTDVEIKSDKEKLYISKLNNIEVYDMINKCNKAPGKLQNMLILAVDPSNKAYPMIHLEIEPVNTVAGKNILWRFIGKTATPESGDFSGGDPIITFEPAATLTLDYQVDIAVDNNGNGVIDSQDSIIRSFSVKVITGNDYYNSSSDLSFFLVGEFLGKKLASSLLFTFLGLKSDAPIQPSNILADDISSNDPSLDHVAGAAFDPSSCIAPIKHYVYDNNEAADIVANSKTILDWINRDLSDAFTSKRLVSGKPYPFYYGTTPIAPIDFSGDFGSDAHMALGHATAKNLTGSTVPFMNQDGRVCVQDVAIQGSIYDLYDFDYFAKGELVLLSKPAATLEFGWNSGLKGNYSGKGEIFKDTIIINKTIHYPYCF